MARYKLMAADHHGSNYYQVSGQNKNSKKDIECWIDDHVKAYGLDWRAGYVIKFRTSRTIYEWRWIKNDKRVSHG